MWLLFRLVYAEVGSVVNVWLIVIDGAGLKVGGVIHAAVLIEHRGLFCHRQCGIIDLNEKVLLNLFENELWFASFGV